jgi:ubiquinone/menaquinone biosynthesis C-methylase UbiE
VDDHVAALREAARILKAHGDFIVGFVDRDSPLGKTYENKKNENVFYREATFLAHREVLALLGESGFEATETVQTVFGSLHEIKAVQKFKSGHGEGGFVVVRARKSC